MRIGQGYDLHKLAKKRVLTLGGVQIPYEMGLLGHSDADVLCHAIIDSLFGAIADGDIGRHFPDSDLKYKDANSILLLKETGKILTDKGFKILNIDSTIILEKPKLAPYIDEMRKNIAEALNLTVEDVSVKAKTNEGMDAVGKKDACEAFSIALVEKVKI